MEKNYKFKDIEIISIIILVMINKLILNIPYYVINLVGNGTISNIIFIGLIDLFFLILLNKLFKNFISLDILDISEFLGGKILKFITAIFSILLFFLAISITLIDFSNVLHTIYFSNFDVIYILLFFVIGTLIANLAGIKGISRTISLIIPFAIFSVIITFFSSIKSINISNLTPILGKNIYSNFVLGISNIFSMYIITYFYFIYPMLENQKKFKQITYISFFVSFFILFLTVLSLLTIFNTNSSIAPINSLFLLSRQIEFGKFLQRVDAIFIFLWIFSIFSYLSITIFMINRIVKKVFNITNEKMISYSTCSILFGLSLIPLNVSNLYFLENIVYRYYIIFFIFIYCFFILLFSNFKKLKKQNLS